MRVKKGQLVFNLWEITCFKNYLWYGVIIVVRTFEVSSCTSCFVQVQVRSARASGKTRVTARGTTLLPILKLQSLTKARLTPAQDIL